MDSTALKSLDVDPATILAESVSLISSVEKEWSQDKAYTYPVSISGSSSSAKVQTYHKKLGKSQNDLVHWSARTTTFSDKDGYSKEQRSKIWGWFQDYLIGDLSLASSSSHTHFEKEYIHELESFTVSELPSLTTKEVDGYDFFAYTTQAIYKLQFPLKKRSFFELILIYKAKDTSEDSSVASYVVSFPIEPKLYKDGSLDGFVLAKYTSVERVEYNKSTDSLVWTMGTCSSPGGSVPDFVANMSMNGVISKDVVSFLNWAGKKSGSQ